MFRSEIERLTICPVCSWSWRAPSSPAQRAEQLGTHVVLHVERHPAALVAPHVHGAEVDHRGDDEQARPDPDRLAVGEDRVVDDVALDERDRGGDHGGQQRAAEREQHRARIPPAVAGQPPQPGLAGAAPGRPPLLVGLPRAALPLAGALIAGPAPMVRRAGRLVLLAGRPRGVCGGPGPPDLVHGPVEHLECVQCLIRLAGLGEQLVQPPGVGGVGAVDRLAAGLGQAEPDHPPVAGLGITPRVSGGNQAVRGRGQRWLGDRQPLGQLRGPLAAGPGQLQDAVLLRRQVGIDPLQGPEQPQQDHHDLRGTLLVVIRRVLRRSRPALRRSRLPLG